MLIKPKPLGRPVSLSTITRALQVMQVRVPCDSVCQPNRSLQDIFHHLAWSSPDHRAKARKLARQHVLVNMVGQAANVQFALWRQIVFRASRTKSCTTGKTEPAHSTHWASSAKVTGHNDRSPLRGPGGASLRMRTAKDRPSTNLPFIPCTMLQRFSSLNESTAQRQAPTSLADTADCSSPMCTNPKPRLLSACP